MPSQMKYTAEQEAQIMETLWSKTIRDDPEAFVMATFPWGEKGTPLERFSGPRTWQRDVLRMIREKIKENKSKGRGEWDTMNDAYEMLRSAISSGRGIGKSALVSWLTLWMLSTRIGSSVRISANSEAQLRSVTWGELSKWIAMSLNSHWWDFSATKVVPQGWLVELVERDMKKGTRYWAAEGVLWSKENPDGFAGPHNMDGMMVIFDEASGIDDPIWPVAGGYFTEPIIDRYWMVFSNPRKNQGYFYECFHSKRDFWTTRNIDSRTVEGTDKTIYEQIIQEHGEDSYEARVEVYGEFPSHGDDQFFDRRVVDEAMGRPLYEDDSAPTIIGVDVARFGSDRTVICVRKGRDIVSIKRVSKLDTMEVVGKVIEAINQWNPDLTVVDEGGLGAGVVDRLKEQRFKVRGVNFGERADRSDCANKRAEIWVLMREWMKGASLPEDKDLKQDLLSPTYKHDSLGRTLLESKDSMRKRGSASPDAADAIAVTFSYAVAAANSTRTPMKNKSLKVVNFPGSNAGWMN